ncbi:MULTISPECIES: YceK/YidQ family lipoprotein [Pseudomonas]|uniref:YceK/YidQ family lipoprotein n=1 Tax=Pseudomonas quercus TaxID=2722792 RepID=A0ABX0YEQ2_9PSED|nr:MULTISPECIES: YceK/YidQ family lipoprotein [Pseudomonas]MBF7143152.1 YceK/YidQ family lipoprotein [Pseudomonas sp. LY10J]NJP01820.1 YceK/YidQ family lipoprotein [Pseudomonas quercus]
MKTKAIAIIIFLLEGCGTIKTNIADDSSIASKLALRKTNCGVIPRIYSGVAYNWCTLDASPTSLRGWNPTLESTLLDAALSGVADTLALPYTLPLQLREGSINLTR